MTRRPGEMRFCSAAAVLLIAALSLIGCQTPAARPFDRDLAVRLNDQAAAELPEHPDTALKLLAEAQAAFPGLPAVHNNVSVAYLEKGCYWEAAVAFRQASAAAPGDPQPLYNLGRTFEMVGNWPLAASYYEQSLRLSPDKLETMESLARVYVKLGRPRSDIAPLAQKALRQEMRPEWVAWLSRYAEADAEATPTAEPSPAGPPPAEGEAAPAPLEDR